MKQLTKISVKDLTAYILTLLFSIFAVFAYHKNIAWGIELGSNFLIYVKFILSIMPGVFLLIGLFRVWVKNETITRHMGDESRYGGFLWALVLSSTAVGGIFAAVPIAHVIFQKGAKLSVVLTYLGAVCVCRIPMTLWEVSLLGAKFSLIRYSVSLPLIVCTSILIEKAFFTAKDIADLRSRQIK